MIAITAQRSWQQIEALPRLAHVAFWLLLVTVFAGPMFLAVFVPVAAVMWAWERNRSQVFDVWSWTRHLSQMVVAMDVGMLVYHALVAAPLSALGLGWLFGGDLGYTWMTVSMVVPMVALMRFQGHDWRMANEMGLGMVAPIVTCFALVRLGICSTVPFLGWLTPTSVYPAAHFGMLLGMIAVMVYRREMYGIQGHATAGSVSPDTSSDRS